MKRLTVGLALGGGGARGFAHIGVLSVFEREDIPVDIIFGTSSGALVGGSYASGIGSAELKLLMEEYLESPEFQSSAINALEDANRRGDVGLAGKIQQYLRNKFWLLQAMFKPGILTAEDFQKMIDYFIPDILVDETKIPFRSVAVDLVSGERIVFSEGSLRSAVMASCAVPGAIEPLQDGTRLLADGGIVSLVPVVPAREEGVDFVIAVNVERTLQGEKPLKTAQEIYDRANEISSYHLAKHEMKDADVLIHPDVGDLNWADFSRATGLIEEGMKAAEFHVREIKTSIRKKGWKRLWDGFFSAGGR